MICDGLGRQYPAWARREFIRRQRTALVLQYFEDLSYKEIAEAMGVSVKSVERLLARGRDALADRLRSEEHG